LISLDVAAGAVVPALWGMTMTLHKLSAGSGYEYLTQQVAALDSTEKGRTSLADYYTARGESPGRWIGSGMAGLDGLAAGDVVSAEQMKHLFGKGLHPVSGDLLGSPFRVYSREGIDGFNSEVSRRLQALNVAAGNPAMAPVSNQDLAAIRGDVAREFFTRQHGREPKSDRELSAAVPRYSRPRQTAVAGFDLTFSPVKSVSALWAVAPRDVAEAIEAAHAAAVADALSYLEQHAAFTREGRNGARQVDIQGLIGTAFVHRDSRAGDPDLHTHVAVANKVQTEEGKWLSIYGSVLYQHVVAASETYNTAIEAHLHDMLGVRFIPRPGTGGDGKRVVREIDGIDPALCERWSSRRAAIVVRQDELSREFHLTHGRPPTPVEAVALAQQANLETREAKHDPRSLGEQRQIWRAEAIQAMGSQQAVDSMVDVALHPVSRSSLQVTTAWIRQAAEATLAEMETHRAVWQDHHVRAETLRQLRAAAIPASRVAQIVDLVVDEAIGMSVNLTPDPDLIIEPAALRRADGVGMYRHPGSDHYTSRAILEAEQRITTAAAGLDGAAITSDDVQIAILEAAIDGATLNDGQQRMVTQMATSGRRVQLALAPAGSGKTTAMRVLADAWAEGGGAVVGLAPSAAAAAALGEATGIGCDTLHKLTHHLTTGTSSPLVDAIGPDTLVIVDEAGMADTLTLDQAIGHITSRGGSVRLIGDDQQLAAVGAGGVLRDIATGSGVCRLDELVRFSSPAEAAASLDLRDGDRAALGFYLDHDRIHVGDTTTSADAVFHAWTTERANGRDCLMLAPTRELVTQLNARARSARLGGTTPGREVELWDENRASAGDVIITRRNDRRLGVSNTDWVKNGDRWTITTVTPDGALNVQHTESGLSAVLPAGYVAAHVDLGYACTVHTAQGLTADSMHGIITGQESRQLLYTMLTRGRDANHVYVPVTGAPDEHPQVVEQMTRPVTAVEILETVIARDVAAVSATTTARHAASAEHQLSHAVARYDDALHAAAEHAIGSDRVDEIGQHAQLLIPGVTHAKAWNTLHAHLVLIDADSHNAVQLLTDAVAMRGLDDADDPAAVLLYRLDSAAPTSAGPLPWLPSVPQRLASDSTWGAYLTARARRVEDLAGEVRQHACGENPAWAGDELAPEVVAEVAVWQAAHDSDPAATRLTAPSAAEGMAAVLYYRRLADILYPRRDIDDWHTRIVEIVGHTDDVTDRLAKRLARLDRQGLDAAQLLTQAAAQQPLPDEHATATLAYRIHALIPATHRRQPHHDPAPTQRHEPPTAGAPGPQRDGPALGI
jgi:conjugative relaxase-like TrwC/TraI family protein